MATNLGTHLVLELWSGGMKNREMRVLKEASSSSSSSSHTQRESKARQGRENPEEEKRQAMGMPGGQGNTDFSGNPAGGHPPEIVCGTTIRVSVKMVSIIPAYQDKISIAFKHAG